MVIVVAYLIGSIPFGYLIVRATRGADVRETGSGGTGATNVSRRAGKAAGVLTLILDALKGAAAVVRNAESREEIRHGGLAIGSCGCGDRSGTNHRGSGLIDHSKGGAARSNVARGIANRDGHDMVA